MPHRCAESALNRAVAVRQLTETRPADDYPPRSHTSGRTSAAQTHAPRYSTEPRRLSRGERFLGKSRQFTTSGRSVSEPIESDVLEQTASIEGPWPGLGKSYGLDPTPIPEGWILDGAPSAREKVLARSTDGAALAFMWDCTSGRFHWEYVAEEIVHVLQGCALVEIAGVSCRLQIGDTHVFPGGSRFRWTVPDYVRIVSLRLQPVSHPLGRRLQAALGGSWRSRRPR